MRIRESLEMWVSQPGRRPFRECAREAHRRLLASRASIALPLPPRRAGLGEKAISTPVSHLLPDTITLRRTLVLNVVVLLVGFGEKAISTPVSHLLPDTIE